MNLMEILEENYPKSIEPEKPRYKAEQVGVFFHISKGVEETSKRTGNIIQKLTAKMTILTKNWYTFSNNFTIKIDTNTNEVSILASKVWFRIDDKYTPFTKSDPLNSITWKIKSNTFDYWKFIETGANNWYAGVASYDMGRGIKEQVPSIIGEILKNGSRYDRPLSDRSFVADISPIVHEIINPDEPINRFDPTDGIETYRLEYDPAQENKNLSGKELPQETTTSVISYPRGANGVYYARKIMSHVDVELLRTLRSADLYCRLEGIPGCGKTALVEASFGDELLTANGNGDYSPSSFIGEWTMNIDRTPENPGEFAWTDGILCRAMKEGRPLLIDEATLLPSSALDAIHSATDGRGYIDLDEFPGKPRIHAQDGFYVIMAYNPDTLHGRELPEAVRSRFNIVLDVKTDFASLDHFEIPKNGIRVASRMNNLHTANIERGGRGLWVPQMRELLGFKKLVDSGLGEDFAFNNWVGLCPEMFRDELTKIIKEVTHKNAKILSLGGLAYSNDEFDNSNDKVEATAPTEDELAFGSDKPASVTLDESVVFNDQEYGSLLDGLHLGREPKKMPLRNLNDFHSSKEELELTKS